jgi:hypothetical protein
MFGYLLLVVCISVFFGFMGFLIMGENTGIGIICSIVGLIVGALWFVSKKNS